MALNAIRSSVDNKMVDYLSSKMVTGGRKAGKSVGFAEQRQANS